MDTLVYASIPLVIGFGLLFVVVGLFAGSLFWSRHYKRHYERQYQEQLDTRLSDANSERQVIIGEVVREVKHQLGNYLNIIKHRLAVMRGEMDNLPPEQREIWGERLRDSLDNIAYYEWRMTQFIENLDFVAHLEKRDAVFAFSEVKPDAIVDDVVRDLHDRAAARRVELSWWARPEIFPRISANHDALRQALINIVDNSIKYAAPADKHTPNGEVDLALSTDTHNTITIRITDNGPGIPPDDLPRLFDKGYTTEAARGRRPKDGGMGLGLYVVKTVVDRHRGMVNIESGVGQGTVITITLPIRRM